MKNKSVLMRVVSDIGRSRALIAVSLLLSAASVVFNLYIPVLAGDAIHLCGFRRRFAVDNEHYQ